jgi:hypothetical protein
MVRLLRVDLSATEFKGDLYKMERGLFWLPLLALFIWLAWAGWNEYRKLEAYKVWAEGFERAKYDIYAVLGQADDRLVWGKPTRQGPVDLQTVSLRDVVAIAHYDSASPPPPEANWPKGCEAGLQLTLMSGATRWIPFTDGDLTIAWQERLQTLKESLKSTPQS